MTLSCQEGTNKLHNTVSSFWMYTLLAPWRHLIRHSPGPQSNYSTLKMYQCTCKLWYGVQPRTLIVHQGGPQMSENGEKIKAINFPHLKQPKAPQKYTFGKYCLLLFPPEHETRSCTHSIQSPGKNSFIIKHQFIIQPQDNK